MPDAARRWAKARAGAAATLALLMLGASAAAQTYPARPVRMVVAFAAGFRPPDRLAALLQSDIA